MSASARSRMASGSRRLLGRPRRRDAKPAAPAPLNARYRRRIWRSLSPSSAAARRRMSRRSASWDMTCSRSSSPIVNATVSAMAPLWAQGGHVYFGETGHLHLGLTAEGLTSDVTSTFPGWHLQPRLLGAERLWPCVPPLDGVDPARDAAEPDGRLDEPGVGPRLQNWHRLSIDWHRRSSTTFPAAAIRLGE